MAQPRAAARPPPGSCQSGACWCYFPLSTQVRRFHIQGRIAALGQVCPSPTLSHDCESGRLKVRFLAPPSRSNAPCLLSVTSCLPGQVEIECSSLGSRHWGAIAIDRPRLPPYRVGQLWGATHGCDVRLWPFADGAPMSASGLRHTSNPGVRTRLVSASMASRLRRAVSLTSEACDQTPGLPARPCRSLRTALIARDSTFEPIVEFSIGTDDRYSGPAPVWLNAPTQTRAGVVLCNTYPLPCPLLRVA